MKKRIRDYFKYCPDCGSKSKKKIYFDYDLNKTGQKYYCTSQHCNFGYFARKIYYKSIFYFRHYRENSMCGDDLIIVGSYRKYISENLSIEDIFELYEKCKKNIIYE